MCTDDVLCFLDGFLGSVGGAVAMSVENMTGWIVFCGLGVVIADFMLET